MGESKVITLNSAEGFRDFGIQLVEQAQRKITIFTPDLEPELYDTASFVNAALAFIKRSRQTELRILALETKHLPESNHQILKLFRYTDKQFQVKKTGAEPAANLSAYLICDDHSILRRQNARVYQGMCYTEDRGRVREQLEAFDQLWESAYADPNLRQLTI